MKKLLLSLLPFFVFFSAIAEKLNQPETSTEAASRDLLASVDASRSQRNQTMRQLQAQMELIAPRLAFDEQLMLRAKRLQTEQPLSLRQRRDSGDTASRLVGNPIDDPLFGSSWHLANSGNNGGKRGEDVNVLSAWEMGFSGSGNIIGIIDSAVDTSHPDLAGNHRFDLSYDFFHDDDEPWTPGSTDSHGTSVAGLAVAMDNDIGSVGVAYGAHFASLRTTLSDSDQYNAITHRLDQIGIYNLSYGYSMDGLHYQSVPEITKLALERGVEQGRNGLGAIYVVAAGNHRLDDAMTNYFAFTNSPFTIPVGAVDSVGQYSYFSNPGSSLFVCAPGGGSVSGMVTTDATGSDGYVPSDYFVNFAGTSAAAPIVSGVVALMLEARPGLGWRDVKHILANTAFPIDPSHSDWQINGAGLWVNHDYGFGRVDATAAVVSARRWQKVGPTQTLEYSLDANLEIPDDDSEGIESTIEVTDSLKVENVEVTIHSDHTYWGDLAIQLISPSGTVSELSRVHLDSIAEYGRWTFNTAFNWGEDAEGEWTLNIADNWDSDTGTLETWDLKITGTNSGNQAGERPSVVDDQVIVKRNEPTVLDVFSNDGNEAGSGVAPVSYYQPAYGTIIYNEENQLVYTPNERFTGTDLFGYTLMNAQGLTGKSLVGLIDPVPFANKDQIVLQTNQSVEFDPTWNDSDANDDVLSVADVTTPTSGTVGIDSDGYNLTYTPPQDFRGHSQFQYTVTDENDGVDVGLVNAFVTDSSDFAILFTEKEDFAYVIHDELTQSTGFTYELWTYPFHYGYHQNALGSLLVTDAMAVYLEDQTVKISVYSAEGELFVYGAPDGLIALDKWQHVAVRYEPLTGFSLFIDGTPVPLSPENPEHALDPGEIMASSSAVLGNTYSLKFGFRGLIDEFRVWDIARTNNQIQTTMDGLSDSELGPVSPILGNWSLNEGKEIYIFDNSSNEMLGILGGPVWSPKDEDLIQFQKTLP